MIGLAAAAAAAPFAASGTWAMLSEADSMTLLLMTPAELHANRQSLLAAFSLPAGLVVAAAAAAAAAPAAAAPAALAQQQPPPPPAAPAPGAPKVARGGGGDAALPEGYEQFEMEYSYASPWRSVILTHLLGRFNQKDAEIAVKTPTVLLLRAPTALPLAHCRRARLLGPSRRCRAGLRS